MTLRAPSRPGGTTPRPRRRGRLSPTNGSVTRVDIQAIYDEFVRGTHGLGPLTAEEFRIYLLGAIVDYSPTPSARRKMRQRWAARRARASGDRDASSKPAQLPTRAAAAA